MARIWRVSYEALDGNGIQIVNTFHVKVDPTAGVDLSASQLVDDVDSWLTTKVRACHTPGTTVGTVKVRESVAEWDGDTPSAAEKTVALAGTMTGSRDGKLEASLCIHGAVVTDVPKRYARGGIYFPPSYHSGDLTATGKWLNSSTYWLNCKALADQLLGGRDYGLGGLTGHISFVVYSLKRHKDGTDPHYFDAKSVKQSVNVARLLSRRSAP